MPAKRTLRSRRKEPGVQGEGQVPESNMQTVALSSREGVGGDGKMTSVRERGMVGVGRGPAADGG